MNRLIKEIRFSRSRGIYKDRNTAYLKLKLIEHKKGQPVIVQYYIDESNEKIDIIFAIGIKDGTGEDCFRIISQSGLIVVEDIIRGSNNIPDVSDLVHGELYLYENDEKVWNYVYLFEEDRVVSPIEGGPYIFSCLKDNYRWFFIEGSLKREDDFYTKEEIDKLENSSNNRLDELEKSIIELDKEVFPLTLNFDSISGYLFLTGEIKDITFKISTNRKNIDVTKECDYLLNDSEITLNENNEYIKTGVNSTTTFSLKSIYKKLNIEINKSILINFGYYFYYGKVSENWDINENNVKSLENKKLQIKQGITYITNLNQEKIVLSYPKLYGKLLHIYDSNNFDYIDDYEVHELNIENVEYFVYLKKTSTTIINFKQSFTY